MPLCVYGASGAVVWMIEIDVIGRNVVEIVRDRFFDPSLEWHGRIYVLFNFGVVHHETTTCADKDQVQYNVI